MATKFSIRLVLTMIFGLAWSIAWSQNPNNDPNWQLVFADEFSSTSVNANLWCRHDHRKYGHGSLETTAYRSDNNDNLSFGGGNIVQIVRAESITDTNQNVVTHVTEPWTYDYSAPSMMISQQKFKYGYFEIRCKLPDLPNGKTNHGIGPNFWLWWHDENPSFEEMSEIDIFEFVSRGGTSHVQTHNAHYDDSSGTGVYDEQVVPNNELPSPDFSQFHTFACHWTPEFIKYYLDDREFHHTTFFSRQMIPQRIIVDINVFFVNEPIDQTTLLPYEYEIDYVRVYKLKNGHCNTDYVNCTPNLLQNSVYRNVRLGGGCTYIQPVGTKRTIWASNSVTINGDYTVPVGADLTLDYSPCYQQEVHSCNAQDCIQCR